MTDQPEVWIGIDAGKSGQHAAAVDADGRLLWSQKVANDQAAIEELLHRARTTAGEVRWAVDLTSNAAALLLAVLVTIQSAGGVGTRPRRASDERHVPR